MKKVNLLLFLSIFLISLTFVSAVPPTTSVFTGDTGINVEINIMSVYKHGEARWSIIHLFNTTTGFQITNATHDNVTCHLHLRDSQGFPIMDVAAVPDEDHWDLNGSGGGNNPIGSYAWTVTCQDLDAEVGGYASGYFEITSNGFLGLTGFYFLIIILSLGLVIIGYYAQDATIVIFGSLGLVFVALYFLFFGIDGINDPVYTWAISIILLGLSAYLMVKASSEFMN